MGAALKYWRDFLEKIGIELDRRTATSLLVLLILLILLPVGLFLVRNQLTFLPRAAGELIQLGEGGCIKLDKNKKKVVDCTTVPLKLINPFYNISGGAVIPSLGSVSGISPAPTSSANTTAPTPTPAASNNSPQVIRVNGNTSTQIQAALDQVKAGGGAVYLPAGTYTINKKVEVYSNVTLFGDGIDQTILDAGVEIDEEESVVGNSTSAGQTNVVIRDMTIRGHSLGSEAAIKLRNLNGGFVVNVKTERGNSGILLGFHSGKGVNNVRISNCQVLSTVTHGIFMTLGENNVIDNCTVNGNGSDSLGIGLEIGVTGKIANNWVVSNSVSNGGHSLTFTAGNDMQFEASWMNANNKVCYNTASGNHIQPIWDQRGTGNIYVGNNVNVNNVNSFGFEEKGGTDPRCDIPAAFNIPAQPAKPSFVSSLNLSTIDASVWNYVSTLFSRSFIDNAYALGLAPALNNSPYKDKLVSYWKFDETSGTSAADTNFQSNSGPGTAVNTTIIAGKFGKARMIPTGAQVNIPNIGEYGDNVMSVSAWVNPTSFPAGASIWNQPEGTSLEYAPEGDGTLQCVIKPIRENQESTFSIKSSGADKLVANQWNHVACTFDMATLKLYINGRQVATGAKSGWVNQPRTSEQVLVGKSRASGQSINGAVDDLAYWNRAITEQDVAAIYNNGQGQAIDLSPANTNTTSTSLPSTTSQQGDSDDNFTGTSGDDSDDVFTGGSGSPSGSGIVKYRLAESQDGLNSAQWRDFAFVPVRTNWAFDFLSGFVGKVLAQDSDDNFTGTSGDDSDDVFTTASSSQTGSPGPVSSGTPTFSVGKQFITTNFQLTDVRPGVKQIWVQYLHPDGSSRVDRVTFDLVDKVPQITGLACNLDISKQSLKITVDGNFFGNAVGTVSTVNPSRTTEILGWTDKQVVSSIKNTGTSVTEGQRFQVKVVRPDGFESPTAVCAVDKSLVSLGARIFCREPGKFDASDVDVTLLYNTDDQGTKVSKVEEKVTISKDGEIDKLKTQLQVGKSYAISIKAPGSLRRTATFTASEGTTQITRPDGTPFILPIGDIAPVINADGQINTLDRAELIRQWRILGTASNKQTGDFNRDTKVNSIDWACMQYDFGSSDEPLPVEVPGSSSGSITIPSGASGTITIPKTSPTPRPSGQ